MKPTIAIIGTGTRGKELAISLSDGPYRLLLFDREFPKAQALVNRILRANPLVDIEVIDCQVNASWEADIIVLAVPDNSLKELTDRIKEVAIGKIVISLSGFAETTTNGFLASSDRTHAEELQQWLPNSKVINVIRSVIDAKPVDAFIAGDDPNATKTVSELMQTADFNPVVIGRLSVISTLANSLKP
jgi:predicted dinucleotide-binding enzyme